MDEMIKFWLETLYMTEIEEVRVAIDNEKMWSLGYQGEEPNPHPQNIVRLLAYLNILEKKLEELK